MSVDGTSRHFAATQDVCRFRSEADVSRLVGPGQWVENDPQQTCGFCMKHVDGFPNSAGKRITAVALLRVHSPRSGVTATEQIRTKAVSTVSFSSA
jgi:hypothetical protein